MDGGSWLSLCNFRPDNLISAWGVGVPVTRSLLFRLTAPQCLSLDVFLLIKTALFKSLQMSTEQKLKLLILSAFIFPRNLQRLCEPRDRAGGESNGSRNDDITSLSACGKFWPPFWLCGCQRGPKWGQNSTILLCTAGYGTLTHSAHPPFSHRCHSNAGSYPDGPPFSGLKDFLQLCDNLGPIWHQGADSRSPVSTSVQLWRWTKCIMCRADVIIGNNDIRKTMNYSGPKLFKRWNNYALMYRK